MCTHTRQLYLRPTPHLLLRCLHQRHSRCNQLRRSTCNLEKEGGGCVHRLRQCTLYYILAGTDARAHAAATLEGLARAADATGARALGRAADTTSPEGTRGRAPDTSPESQRKAVAMLRPPRRRRAPPLHAGVTAHVTGRAVRRIVRSTTRAWATSRVSSTWHLMVSPNRIYRTKTYSQFACTQVPPSGVMWRAQATLRPVTKWYRSRHTLCRPPA